ncbi:MAG TPA: P-type conjugative transfer protein TrbL, partial [Candidatus Competibacteraceae bacterium]|nr:P-type conjugative transfer protein TrbL [Candidatus Competibacteraceae bacterium]
MKKYFLILLTLGIFLLVTQPALAQGILTTLQNRYDSATAGWMTRSLVYARNLFFLLAAIEIAVTSIFYLFQKEGIAEFFSGLLIKVLALLFFYTLLIQSPQWIPAIIQSFIKAGQGVGNIAIIDPSAVMGQGLTLAAAMLDGVKTASLWNSLGLIIIAGLSSLGVVLAYIVIAGQLFVTLIESYLVLGGGVLLLGFGGSRWGLPFVERFLGYVIAIGVKLLVLFLLISLGTTLVPQLSQVLADA